MTVITPYILKRISEHQHRQNMQKVFANKLPEIKKSLQIIKTKLEPFEGPKGETPKEAAERITRLIKEAKKKN